MFVVELPAARAPVVGQASEPDGGEQPARVPPCHVLIVDDEPDVSGLLEAILAEDGHRVETAADGEEALERLSAARQAGDAFDLLLSDINMPGMRGPELYDRLVAQDEALARRLVFVTGDALDPGTLAFLRSHGLTYVEKPFSLDELGRALGQVWSREEAPDAP